MEPSHNRRVDLWYTICIVGSAAALIGFGLAWLIFQWPGPQGGWTQHAPIVIPLVAALASLGVSPFLWWRWISKPSAFSVRQGVRIGVACSLLAHPLIWWLVTLFYAFSNIDHVAADWEVRLLVEGLLVLPLASLVLLGWLTALLGAGVGAILVLIQRHLQRPAGERIV